MILKTRKLIFLFDKIGTSFVREILYDAVSFIELKLFIGWRERFETEWWGEAACGHCSHTAKVSCYCPAG